jgi:hypothetical protein
VPTVVRRPVTVAAAGVLASCALITVYAAATDSMSGRGTPLTKQQQFEQFKSQFPGQ